MAERKKAFKLGRIAVKPGKRLTLAQTVDAFGEIKTRISPLKKQEKAYRDKLAASGKTEIEGEFYRVKINTHDALYFNRDAAEDDLFTRLKNEFGIGTDRAEKFVEDFFSANSYLVQKTDVRPYPKKT